MSRKIAMLLTAVLFNAAAGALFAEAAGFSPAVGAVGMNAAGVLMGMRGGGAPVLRAGVYAEIWTGELVKALRGGLAGSWLDGVPDQSALVNNDVIHLVDVGVDPEVLINNTTYPIPMQALDDKDIAISLDKFQSKVTPVSDDELYAISYDKMARVKESHGNAINDAKFAKAAHALCANGDTAETPVLKTTGVADPETGRRRLTMEDVLGMKRALDRLKVPSGNRRLVLCPDHANDLLLADQHFREQYNIDRNTGRIGSLYGFQVYEYGNNPVYDASGNKKEVGAVAGEGEFQCSFAFYTPRVFKATGSTKMYYSESRNDPEYQRNKINFRHCFICMFKKADAGVVMTSGAAGMETAAPSLSGADSLSVDDKAGSNVRTYATSNGAPVTAESNADWLTVSASGNKVTFTRTANDTGSERTGHVTVGVEGSEVTMQVAVTQAAASA